MSVLAHVGLGKFTVPVGYVVVINKFGILLKHCTEVAHDGCILLALILGCVCTDFSNFRICLSCDNLCFCFSIGCDGNLLSVCFCLDDGLFLLCLCTKLVLLRNLLGLYCVGEGIRKVNVLDGGAYKLYVVLLK